MTELSRYQEILERLRAQHYPQLSADLVARLGEIEDRNQFSPDPAPARNELRRLVDMEVKRQEVEMVEGGES